MAAPGENCSSACLTKDHRSFGECVRSKGIRHHALGGTGHSNTDQKRFERTNARYRQAVKDGLQPQQVSEPAINRAYEAASGGT